jgi:hypothetical protein
MTAMRPGETGGVVLLGWKTRDRALTLLQQECEFDPPLNDNDAEALWARYREHVNALRGRPLRAAARLALTDEEHRLVADFLQDQASHAGSVQSVVKVDPLGLVAHQLEITTDRSTSLSQRLQTPADWALECLCPAPSSERPTIRHAPNSMDVDLPHGEWALVFDSRLGLVLGEAARCITVTTIGPYLVLWSGYHRTYASIASRPEGEATILAAEMDDVFHSTALSPRRGDPDGVAAAARSCGLRAVQSDNPPVFSDFFNPALALPVRFRAKRFTMEIRARMVAASVEASV